YELDVALEALARVAASRPAVTFHLDVYGRGDAAQDWRHLAASLGLADRVTFHGRIAIEEMPTAIAAADIGLAPTRRTSFTDVSLSTKVFEYGAMAKPVIATKLPMVEATFPPGTVWTYEPGDAASLASAIESVLDDPAARERAVSATTAVVRERSWEREVPRYLDLIDRLARD
ncbi:MAG TPA: glycosyltransferase family 4 protein, partial [Candidatus Limnocylindrales bacterium]|nr:glycosyltransferase family 4 protein [Candidatus Limnocylindrales bacterium]